MNRALRTLVASLAAAGLAGLAHAADLNECIHAALTANPDVQAAVHRAQAAREAIGQARAGYYPQVSASSAFTRTDNPPQAFMMVLNQRTLTLDGDFNHPDDTENLRMSLGAKYRVFDGGRRGLGVDMAEQGASMAEDGAAAARNGMIYEVMHGYYSVLQAQAFRAVQEQAVQSLAESLRVAEERHAAGTAVKTDVLNLAVKMAQAREDLIRAGNGVQLAIAALNTAIGRELIGSEGLTAPPAAEPPPLPAMDPAGAAARPERRAARAATMAAERGLSLARRDVVPAVSAFGSLDWDSDSINDFQDSYFVGVMAEWDAFTGFRRSHSRREAQARWEAAQAEEASADAHLRLDITQARLGAKEAHERLGVTRATLASAQEALRITRERYQQGAADITELLTAEVGLSSTRMHDASAYYDYLTALANLDRAGGRIADAFITTQQR